MVSLTYPWQVRGSMNGDVSTGLFSFGYAHEAGFSSIIFSFRIVVVNKENN